VIDCKPSPVDFLEETLWKSTGSQGRLLWSPLQDGAWELPAAPVPVRLVRLFEKKGVAQLYDVFAQARSGPHAGLVCQESTVRDTSNRARSFHQCPLRPGVEALYRLAALARVQRYVRLSYRMERLPLEPWQPDAIRYYSSRAGQDGP